ncbi:hypothetical protein OROGR_006337 [Orobanche gracilis]
MDEFDGNNMQEALFEQTTNTLVGVANNSAKCISHRCVKGYIRLQRVCKISTLPILTSIRNRCRFGCLKGNIFLRNACKISALPILTSIRNRRRFDCLKGCLFSTSPPENK